MDKLYRKRFGIYDMYHKSFFQFAIDEGEKYTGFATRKEAEDAIAFCNLVFFSMPHKFVVKSMWQKIER